MQTNHTRRSRRFKIGLATVATGMLLAVVGLSTSPAGAAPKGSGGEITLCHRTNSTSNPYRIITVAFSGSNGELQGPDHTGHAGPAFDYSADPAVAYPPPHNGDQWGDIIPPYTWDGGSYPGSDNWTEGGEAIHDEGCNGATVLCWDESEPVEGQCPEQPDDVCPDLAGFQSDPADCPAPTDVCPNLDGVQTDPADCPAPDDVCPNLDGVQTNAAVECPTLVISNTLTPPVQVEGIQVVRAAPAAPTLPRTGTGTLPLAELGFGFMLLGAGALIFAREQAATV